MGDHVALDRGVALGHARASSAPSSSKGSPVSLAVRWAHNNGYTEADPRDDLSGLDSARKAVILAREMGLRVEVEEVAVEPLFPPEALRPGTLDELYAALRAGDVGGGGGLERRRAGAARSASWPGSRRAPTDGRRSTSGRSRSRSGHPAARLNGVEAMVAFTTRAPLRPAARGPGGRGGRLAHGRCGARRDLPAVRAGRDGRPGREGRPQRSLLVRERQEVQEVPRAGRPGGRRTAAARRGAEEAPAGAGDARRAPCRPRIARPRVRLTGGEPRISPQGREEARTSWRGSGAPARRPRASSGSPARRSRVGITTDALDEIAHAEIVRLGGYPSPLNYRGFPKSICTSVNEVICHGIPDSRPLEDGDIVNLDVTVFLDGMHGDCSATFLVGERGRGGAAARPGGARVPGARHLGGPPGAPRLRHRQGDRGLGVAPWLWRRPVLLRPRHRGGVPHRPADPAPLRPVARGG